MKHRDVFAEVVHSITTSYPSRPATSLAEAQAAAFLDGVLRRVGMRVSADPFRAPTQPSFVPLLLSCLGIIVSLLTASIALPTVLLAIWLLIVTISDLWLSPLPTLGFHRDSQNIVGTQASTQTPLWRVVCLAPLDTPPPRSLLAHRLSWHRLIKLGHVVAFPLLLVITIGTLYLPTWSSLWWSLRIGVIMWFLVSFLPHRLPVAAADYTVGALATVVAVAEQISMQEQVEMWVVGLGATATTTQSIEDFLARYPFPRDQTIFLLVEGVDGGDTGVILSIVGAPQPIYPASHSGQPTNQSVVHPFLKTLISTFHKEHMIVTEAKHGIHSSPLLDQLKQHGYWAVRFSSQAETYYMNPTSNHSNHIHSSTHSIHHHPPAVHQHARNAIVQAIRSLPTK